MEQTKAHLPKKLLVSLILTRRCILTCPYCALIKDEVKELPVQWWMDAIAKLAPYTEDFIFCGAEPILFKDIELLLKFVNDQNLSYSFCTTANPTLLKKVDGLIKSYSVSVDTLRFKDASIPSSIRDKSKWGWDIVNRYGQASSMANFVETVITEWNQDDIIPMLNLFSKTRFTICLDIVQSVRGEVRSYSFTQRDNDGVKQAEQSKIDQILEYVLLNYDRLKMVDGREYYESLQRGEIFRCQDKGTRSLTLDSDGSVSVCNDKMHSKLGTLDEFLDGDPELLAKYGLIQKKCTGCMFNCYYSFYNNTKWTKSSV